MYKPSMETPRLCPLIKMVGRTGMLVARILGGAKEWESQWGPSWSWSGWLTSFRSCWGDLEESHLVPSRCWGCHLSLFDKSCIYIYIDIYILIYINIYIYMILYWVWPPPSKSGKRRLIGIPYYWKCNDFGVTSILDNAPQKKNILAKIYIYI